MTPQLIQGTLITMILPAGLAIAGTLICLLDKPPKKKAPRRTTAEEAKAKISTYSLPQKGRDVNETGRTVEKGANHA